MLLGVTGVPGSRFTRQLLESILTFDQVSEWFVFCCCESQDEKMAKSKILR